MALLLGRDSPVGVAVGIEADRVGGGAASPPPKPSPGPESPRGGCASRRNCPSTRWRSRATTPARSTKPVPSESLPTVESHGLPVVLTEAENADSWTYIHLVALGSLEGGELEGDSGAADPRWSARTVAGPKNTAPTITRPSSSGFNAMGPLLSDRSACPVRRSRMKARGVRPCSVELPQALGAPHGHPDTPNHSSRPRRQYGSRSFSPVDPLREVQTKGDPYRRRGRASGPIEYH